MITGAGSGIGRATAIAFARAQADVVVVTGRQAATLAETRSIIGSQSLKTIVNIRVMDVTQSESVETVFKDVVEKFGSIDICIHGASHLSEKGKLHESSLDNFWNSIEANVKGSFIVNHAFTNQPATESKDRVLLFMNSCLAYVDALNQKTAPASYAISKLAQAKLVEYSASDMDHDKRFRVYAVHPGVVVTEMSDRSIAMAPTGTREALTWDSPDLPGQFFVWLASSKGTCIPSGKYLWANWDVEELEARREEIASNPLALTQTMHGWPFEYRG